MNVLAIIPARGGSKSIPRKNIRELCGKPLIAWSIEEAKKSKYVTRVICSTDDPEIAEVAAQYGAEVPFLRPAEISGDLATDVEFLTHTLNFLKESEGYEPDVLLRLAPTSPLRTAEDIDVGIETLMKNPEADAVRAIHESPKHPYKMWRISEDGKYLQPFLPKEFTNMDEPYNGPRQLLPKVHVHTGAVDVYRPSTILELKSTSGRRLAFFWMPEERSVNIDHEIDFQIAETLMNRRSGEGRSPRYTPPESLI